MIVMGSHLEALFSGRWENQLFRDAQGRVFMDVDPCLFRKILEYVYRVKLSVGSDELPPLPSVPKGKQSSFRAYVDFIALRSKDVASDNTAGTEEDAVDQGDGFSIQDHKSFIASTKAEFDETEKKLAVEDSFFAFFTKGNPRNGSDESPPSGSANDESDSSRLEGCNSDEILVVRPNATKKRGLNEEDLGIMNLYVNGEVLAVKISTLCSDPASKLAQNLTDKTWLQEHDIKTENGKRCYLIEQPAFAFKALIDYMQLKSFIEDVNSIPLTRFEDAEEKHYFQKMFQHFFPANNDIVCACSMESSHHH